MRERLSFLLLLKAVPRGRLPVTKSVSLTRRGSHRKAKSARQSSHRHLRRTSRNHQSQRHRRPRQPRQPIHHEIIRFSSHEAKLVEGRRPLRRQSMEARNLDIIASLCSHGRYRYCLISGSKRLRKSPLAWSPEKRDALPRPAHGEQAVSEQIAQGERLAGLSRAEQRTRDRSRYSGNARSILPLLNP